MSQKDPYAILKVSPGAELSEIEAAYWLLAPRYKAALGIDPDAPRLVQELNRAYESLTTAQPQPRSDERPRRIPANLPKRNSAQQPGRISAWMMGITPNAEEQREGEARAHLAERAVLSRPQARAIERDGEPDGERETGIPESKPSRPSFLRRLGRLWQRHPHTVDKQRVLARAERAAGLRASTAATVARWRKPGGLPGSVPPDGLTVQSSDRHPPAGSQP
jgi:curved DNA-binding protein CbpA